MIWKGVVEISKQDAIDYISQISWEYIETKYLEEVIEALNRYENYFVIELNHE